MQLRTKPTMLSCSFRLPDSCSWLIDSFQFQLISHEMKKYSWTGTSHPSTRLASWMLVQEEGRSLVSRRVLQVKAIAQQRWPCLYHLGIFLGEGGVPSFMTSLWVPLVILEQTKAELQLGVGIHSSFPLFTGMLLWPLCWGFKPNPFPKSINGCISTSVIKG